MLHKDSTIDLQNAPEPRQRNGQSVDSATQPMEMVRTTISAAEKKIGEHPVAALGLALVAGLALGWVVKRW